MRIKALALVVGSLVSGFAVVAASAANFEDQATKDAKVLDGTWQVVSQQTDGKDDAIPADGGDTLVINGGKYTSKREGKEVCAGTFTLDSTKSPKTINDTFTAGEFKGKVALGIYEATADQVRVSWSLPGDTNRPTGFDVKSHRLTTLKRLKA